MKFEPELEIVKFSMLDVIATSEEDDPWGSHDIPIGNSEGEIIVLG